MAEAATCPYCGGFHPVEAAFCPVTGQRLPSGWGLSTPPKSRARLWFRSALGLLAVFAVGGVYLLVNGTNPPSSADSTVQPPEVAPGDPHDGDAVPSATAGFLPPSASDPSRSIAAATPTTAWALTQAVGLGAPSTTATPYRPGDEPVGRIVYTCQVYRDEARNQICIINADGTGEARLTREDHVNHSYPVLAPDGQNVVYARGVPVDGDLYEIDLAGNARQLTSLPGNEYAPSISPDGQQIVFVYNDTRHQTLWLANRDGTGLRQLTDGSQGDAWDPVWSPDGREVLYAGGADIQLFILNLVSLSVRQVSRLDNLRGRSDWSPDGGSIATYAGPPGDRQIVVLDTSGGNVTFLTDTSSNLAPNFSPDGSWIAFTSYMGNPNDLEDGCEIYLMRLADITLVRLTHNDYCDFQPNWGP